MTGRRARGIDRRAFVKSALAIGGASALSACLDRTDDTDVPQGSAESLPERQHAWGAFVERDEHGNAVPVPHRLLLLLDYDGEGTPTEDERETVERALATLEDAYAWSHDGLLSTMAYSPSYFERFESSLPERVDLPAPEALASFENPALDAADAALHLASDHGHVLLAVEQALTGERDALNGVSVDASFDGVFSVAERRTGFTGDGLPAENQDVRGVPDSEPVPEDAPLYMGFKSTYEKTQASEDRVTIAEGAFAGGTTQHVSHMLLNLQQWYEQDDREQRVGKMFCPYHAENDVVEGAGDNLGSDAKMEKAKPAERAADEDGVVGHSQKMVSLREDGRPIILRRDFDSTDGGHAGLHFVSYQREIADFLDTRDAMTGADLAAETPVGQRNNNGILQYMNVTSRGNYLVPPRSKRALPTPEGDA
ncbi:Tat pathway signal protein [Halarchaeum grantii]|uniref:Tat pathway signal protein n=1 Tax=Halarchaeum grantii TaxID=1193105 RepID=A0A830ERP9_9EURY|nr:Dyp-type peroxidase domain-containing protein [Halarchaeum grantii]GGL22830.1 Tat pathway signal protein [Halarchaeum grantii]